MRRKASKPGPPEKGFARIAVFCQTLRKTPNAVGEIATPGIPRHGWQGADR
jgi:hypothetical protein